MNKLRSLSLAFLCGFVSASLFGVAHAGPDFYVYDGDGTVTDFTTGLMWEMALPNTDSRCTGPAPDVRCVQNSYTWSSSGNYIAADGTLFTVFLATLNGGDYFSPSAGVVLNLAPGTCFVRHCDWRIPTIVELQGILLAPCPGGLSTCIAKIFGPTQPSYYWSNSSMALSPNDAWIVNFNNGGFDYDFKNDAHYVRAVRRAW